MTHTPGPWEYEPATKTIRSMPTNYWLASMDSWDGAVNHESNAHLIAAAPDLLAALKAMTRRMDMLGPEYDEPGSLLANARAAITKATGH